MKNKSLKNQLENMSSKEKISYIWEYYKLHIIFTLILIFVVASFTYSQVTKKQVYFNITYIGDCIDINQLYYVKDNLNDIILHGDDKKNITLDSIFIDEKSIKEKPQYLEKLMVKVAAGEVDIAIVDKDFFESNFDSDIFLNLESLDDFFSLRLSDEEVLEKVDSSGTKGVYGIKTENLKLLNNVKFITNDTYLVVMSNSKRTNKTVNILKFFLLN